MVYVKSHSNQLRRRTRKALIGITIDEDGIRYVRYNPKRAIVEQAGMLPLEYRVDEDGVQVMTGLGETLKNWAKQNKLSGSRVHLAAPASQSFIRLIQVPKAGKRQLRRVTDLEVEGSIRLPFDQPIIDYHWFGEEAGHQDKEHILTLVAAVPYPVVMERVSALEEASIHPVSVDLSAVALLRILKHQELLNDQRMVMAVNFKGKEAEVYLYHRGIPDFIRTFPLDPLAQDQMNTWRYEEIVSSLNRIINFYEQTMHEGTDSVRHIYITGTAPDQSAIVSRLSDAFPDVAVSDISLDSFFNRKGAAAVQQTDQGSYSIALGLAMRGAGL